MMEVSIKTVADCVVERLSQEGVKIQMYEAYSTNSIYLKFDFGMCNSLRISDHKGKQNLNYMFNLDARHKGKPKTVKDKFTRYYYGFDKKQFEDLIRHILHHRQMKIKKLGLEKYSQEMEDRHKSNKNNKGFWAQSKIVN